ncbi:MAG: ACT domain-containing protein [Oscillospiraceae bacterium]|jgi:hypothetical protein|nr:ACT domain-containing protein [Oscillospiraceae bacterium]
MIIKQLSIFVENKTGRLSGITRALADAGVNIKAISVADTKDFGILRVIADNPELARDVLKEADCTVTLTDVISVEIEDRAGGLADVVDLLFGIGISIEYMYAFPQTSEGKARVVLRVDDNEKAIAAIDGN